MNLLTLLRFVFFLSIVSLVGCDPISPVTPESNSQQCHIAKETIVYYAPDGKFPNTFTHDGETYKGSGQAVITYQYDKVGRVTEMVISEKLNPKAVISPSRTTYAYSASGLTINQAGRSRSYSLNSMGCVLSNGETETFEYDAEGYLRQKTDSVAISRYSVENGNTVKEDYTDHKPVQRAGRSTTIEYDVTKPNLPAVFQFEGRQSRNLPRRIIRKTRVSEFVDFAYIYDYQYEFDGKGRVIKKLEKATSAVFYEEAVSHFEVVHINVSEFTYTCP